jgi:spoIIIJ-associated protein
MREARQQHQPVGLAAPAPSAVEREPRAARVRRWFAALAEAYGTALDVEVEDSGASGLKIAVRGDAELDDAEWQALEMLLQRAFGPPREAGRVRLEAPGRRRTREATLRERALELARAVQGDGEARETEPLNSYERRLIHIAVAEIGGLATESLGDGAERRVSIRRAPAEP